jgi:hypothetical protein
MAVAIGGVAPGRRARFVRTARQKIVKRRFGPAVMAL